MGKRHRGREAALQCLYQWDSSGGDANAALEHTWLLRKGNDPPGTQEFARQLVSGVVASIQEIDGLIGEQADNWRVGRMGAVDRNVLRLGVYELMHGEAPPAVVIDEAIELAKEFSDDTAGQFVNGVLDGIRHRIGGESEVDKKSRSQDRRKTIV